MIKDQTNTISKKINNLVGTVLAIAFLVIALFFSIKSAYETSSFNHRSKSVSAVLGHFATEKTNLLLWTSKYEVTYTFAIDGHQYTGEDTIDYEPQSPATVFYDPKNPWNNKLAKKSPWASLIFAAISLLLLLLFLWSLFFGSHKEISPQQKKSGGLSKRPIV